MIFTLYNLCTVAQPRLKFCDFVSNGSRSSHSALRNNTQHGPSCFTLLTSSLEADLTRQQRLSTEAESEEDVALGTHLKFERLHIVGARSEVRMDQSTTAEWSTVRILLQPHAVSLAVAAVQALSVAT